jgi:two-component system C4-dicarboxylate transport sensor histidine kinase DctB
MLRPVVNRIRNTVVLVMVALALGSLAYWNSARTGLQSMQENADRRLDRFASALFAPTEKFNYLPEVVANHPVVTEALLHKCDPGHQSSANTFLERLNAATKTQAIYLMGTDGRICASSNWNEQQSNVGKNFSFRPYFIDALRSGSGRFYGMGASTHTPVYFMSHTVQQGPTVSGVAVVAVDLRNFDGYWGRNGEFTVSDADGVIFLSSRKDWTYRSAPVLKRAVEDKMRPAGLYAGELKQALQIVAVRPLRHDSRIVEVVESRRSGRGTESTPYLLTSRVLPEANWTISSAIPLKENQSRAIFAACIAVGAASLVLMLILYARQNFLRMKEREASRQVLEMKNRALQRMNDALHTVSITDHLTGAYTRRFFFESLGKLVHAARRHCAPLAVIVIDLDNFKQINDTYGHPAGDEVLQSIVGTCRRLLRQTDVFARLGGEEFIIALPCTDGEVAQEVAERLRLAVMSTGVTAGNVCIHVTISIGISVHCSTDLALGNMIERADRALYKAKRAGRNQVVIDEARSNGTESELDPVLHSSLEKMTVPS